jgi:hypothetical protein
MLCSLQSPRPGDGSTISFAVCVPISHSPPEIRLLIDAAAGKKSKVVIVAVMRAGQGNKRVYNWHKEGAAERSGKPITASQHRIVE